MKTMYQKPVVVDYTCEEESTILAGSAIITNSTTMQAAEQELGIEIDMSGSNFNHTWE